MRQAGCRAPSPLKGVSNEYELRAGKQKSPVGAGLFKQDRDALASMKLVWRLVSDP